MTKKQMILIAIAIIFITAIVIIFSSFGYYKVDIYPDGVKKVLVRKIKNENMFMNFLKPAASTSIQLGDLILFKSTALHDPEFKDKENLCARVIGMPGDQILIKDSKVFVNNVEITEAYQKYFLYRISMPDTTDFKTLLGKYDLDILYTINGSKACDVIATPDKANELSKIKGIVSIRQVLEYEGQSNSNVYHSFGQSWNLDNFGPIIVPQQGVTVLLNRRNFAFYKDIIGFFEEHQYLISGDNITIDNKPADKYIIEDNYYFVLSDNRFNAPDSRTLGFIPESYIVGKIIK